MIPMVVYLFILVVSLYFTIFSIAPVLNLIPELAKVMDTSGSIYVNVEGYYNLAVRGFFFMIAMMVGIRIIHLYLIATKKQRFTGGSSESDF